MSKLSFNHLMGAMCGYQLMLIIIRTDICDSVLCRTDANCECTEDEPCQLIMNCIDGNLTGTCEGGSTLTCRASQPCSLLCIGEQACANSTLVLNRASSISVKCVGGAACDNITVDSGCTSSTSTPTAAPTPAMHAHMTSLAPTTSTSHETQYSESYDDSDLCLSQTAQFILFTIVVACCVITFCVLIYCVYKRRRQDKLREIELKMKHQVRDSKSISPEEVGSQVASSAEPVRAESHSPDPILAAIGGAVVLSTMAAEQTIDRIEKDAAMRSGDDPEYEEMYQ